MKNLYLNIEGEDFWYTLGVEPETYSFYSHLHLSTVESPRSLVSTIMEFDALSRTIKKWEQETKEEIDIYNRLQSAKEQASKIFQ